MKLVCATMFLAIACGLIGANAQMVFRSSKYEGKDCAGSPAEDTVMSLQMVAAMYMGVTKLGVCSPMDTSFVKLDAATCKMMMYSTEDCSGEAFALDMAYSAAECENHEEGSEKSGCVDSVPAGAKDLTCMTMTDMTAIGKNDKCVDDCTKSPTTKAEFDEMKAGCASDCPADVIPAYEKYALGCAALQPETVTGDAAGAHSQVAHLCTVPAILLLGFFSH